MKLSIITINYNNAAGLKRTLTSVSSQTYRDIEHIIIDGGSTDGSVDVIREYASVHSLNVHSFNVIWVSEPDKGIYNAMNKGIEIALGKRVVNKNHTSNTTHNTSKEALNVNRSELVNDDHTSNITHHTSLKEHHTSSITHNTSQESLCDYVQILNSGDLLAAPDVTERMMAALEHTSHITHHTSISILYGNMLKAYTEKEIVRDTCGGNMYTPESFLYFYKGTLNHDCAYIRRDLFEKYGLYNEEMKICSDWEWYVKVIALGGEKAVYTNIDVTIFDMNGVSESHGKNAELIKKERREYLEKILPATVLHDYDAFSFPVLQYQRLKKYHLWGIVYFMERVLFKLEKWHVLK